MQISISPTRKFFINFLSYGVLCLRSPQLCNKRVNPNNTHVVRVIHVSVNLNNDLYLISYFDKFAVLHNTLKSLFFFYILETLKMISISRISLISSHLYSVKCLSPLRTYSILQLTSQKIFNDLRPAQTFFSLKQRNISSDKELKEKIETPHAKTIAATQLSQKARLKQAVRDYGATIIVFHVAISLASLGICYVAVSNGIDAVSWLKKLGFPESVISSKVAVESSTFLMSYAVHKLFAPVRIGITLSTAPFIVRYLRKKNLIKPPK